MLLDEGADTFKQLPEVRLTRSTAVRSPQRLRV